MSIHIAAPEGAVSDKILLPGDPLRAKFIAENYLESPVLYNEVRGMLGYTGTYKGVRISVQGTGMGMPSHSIYVHELIAFHGVKRLIRVGSCGSLQPWVDIRDLIMGVSAATDSAMVSNLFGGLHYAPAADWTLMRRADATARDLKLGLKAGTILSADNFYNEDTESWKLWAKFGVLAVEMEAAALYAKAARFGVQALCLLTVSDSLVTKVETTSEEREKTFTQMMELALETIIRED